MLSTKYYMIKRASDELKEEDIEARREELTRKLITLNNTDRRIQGRAPFLGGAATWGIGRYRGSKSPIKNKLSGRVDDLLTISLINALFTNQNIRKPLFELDVMPTEIV